MDESHEVPLTASAAPNRLLKYAPPSPKGTDSHVPAKFPAPFRGRLASQPAMLLSGTLDDRVPLGHPPRAIKRLGRASSLPQI
jgi:hypothetical protein